MYVAIVSVSQYIDRRILQLATREVRDERNCPITIRVELWNQCGSTFIYMYLNKMYRYLNDDILLNGILPFIGKYHFRYIAGISRQFYRSYTTVDPGKETYVFHGNDNIKSLLSIDYIPALFQLCLDEIDKETLLHILRDDPVIS